ncbi:MAG TPA: hypothetical protein VGP33_02515 [Chloroflexota bacterium]|jgi:hypothetical protein|nr:hypothetical protein [Chloroflexota bacterium]
MADSALFIGWGAVVPGREKQAFQVFGEGIQYWTRLQQQGEIESFEPLAFEPHGGELLGCCIIRGEREKLNRLRYSAEWLRLNNRAGACVERLGVVTAFGGAELQRQFAEFQSHVADLAR